MAPTTADIRKFLIELFNDEELTILCYDYFRDVYDDFALGMSKGQKIQLLIDYCGRREAISNLLAAMAAERAAQYAARFGARVEAVVPPAEQPHPGRDPRQVFFSHAHEDAEFAHRLAADLRVVGWRVWIMPDSILPGEKWVAAIERGLATSGLFVVVLTPAAIRSRWVKTETNAAIALEHREAIRLAPLDVESCDAPLLWSSYQFISFRDRYEDGLRGLLGWLDPSKGSVLAQPPIPRPAPAALPDNELRQAVQANWEPFLGMAGKRCGTPVPAALRSVKEIETIGDAIVLRFSHTFSRDLVNRPENRSQVEALWEELLKARVQVRCALVGEAVAVSSPVAGQAAARPHSDDDAFLDDARNLGAVMKKLS
jgi:hypothetical protein